MPALLPLAELPRVLRDAGFVGVQSRRKLRELATDCIFPAERVNGWWSFDPTKTEAIAADLGLEREGASRDTASVSIAA